MKSMPYKQPNEVLDYDFDYSVSLPTGDTIASSVVSVSPAGLTLGAKTSTSTAVKQWVSGGTDGIRYTLTCLATTTQGRVIEAEMVIPVKEL